MPRGIENSIIDFCRSLYGSVGWLGVFLAMAIESAAIPIPSEVIMPLAGWLLLQDSGSSRSCAPLSRFRRGSPA
jgi:membrane protein DedA with SNARE-associated domain